LKEAYDIINYNDKLAMDRLYFEEEKLISLKTRIGLESAGRQRRRKDETWKKDCFGGNWKMLQNIKQV
jgi:hypothetical protein